MPLDIKPGDLLCESFCNTHEYYQVLSISLTGKSVNICEIGRKVVMGDHICERIITPDLSQHGGVLTKRVMTAPNGDQYLRGEHGSRIRKCSGNPVKETWE